MSRSFWELNSALAKSEGRVRAVDPDVLEHGRGVGRKHLSTTVGGLW